MLGDRVAVVVDGGATAGAVPSTIVDVTGDRPRLLRLGVISVAQLDEALAESGLTVETDEPEPTTRRRRADSRRRRRTTADRCASTSSSSWSPPR